MKYETWHPADATLLEPFVKPEGTNMMESEQTAELATALAKAQGQMRPAVFNKKVDYVGKSGSRKYSYADLSAVMEVVRKPLSDNGLSVTQITELRDGMLVLRTTLRHASGQWLASEYPLPLGAQPQEMGSARTYGRRYELSALLGVVADEDDDGEATRHGNGKVVVVPTGEVLSEEQCQTLVAALEAREMPVKRLMKYVSTVFGDELAEVADIPAELYEQCLEKIQQQGSTK